MENYLSEIVSEFKVISSVESIAIGGSSAYMASDNRSDIDVYIFVNENIPVSKREEIIKKHSSLYEIGCEYFGSGDEFLFDKAHLQLDVMYFNIYDFESMIKNVWCNYGASNGYSTCFLYTLSVLNILFDKNSKIKNLKEILKNDYPTQLQENIIKRNMFLMKKKPFASYFEQIEKAIARNDKNSINHRISAFLASYFDVIFAVNKMLHPGEKRLVEYAKNNCKILPLDFEKNINSLLIQPNCNTLKILDDMFNNLNQIVNI